MAERIELVSTPTGGENTKSTEDMKTDAWKIAEDLGIKDEAKMSYTRTTGAFAMTLSDAVAPEKVAAFTEATAPYRTPEAYAELATALPAIKEAAAASRAENPEAPAKDAAAKAPKEPKEPQLPRTNIAIFPQPAEIAGDPDMKKAATAAMLKTTEKVIEDLGMKDVVKPSYNIQAANWVVGGRGLSDDNVKALEGGLAEFRTPELEANWRSNAPVKEAAAKDTGAKGPVEGPDVSAAAKDVGASR